VLCAVTVVEPGTPDLVARDAREPAVVDESLVRLNKAESLCVATARLGADPDLIENLRERARVIPEEMKPVVPLGVLDDHGDRRVDLFGRRNKDGLGQLCEQGAAVFAPGTVALRGSGLVAHIARAEEVIHDERVEDTRCHAHHGFEITLGLFVLPVEPAERTFLTYSEISARHRGDAADDLDALTLEPVAHEDEVFA